MNIHLYPDSNIKIKVDISNGSPYISVSGNFIGRIYTMKPDLDYTDYDSLKKVSDATNKYLNQIFSAYLYRTAKEFKSDINGFGKSSLLEFKTTDEFENYDWLSQYENSFFDVDFKTNIKSGFLLMQT